jgi:hypothetical protein
MGLVELARRWVEPKPAPAPELLRKQRPLRNPIVVETHAPEGATYLTAPLEIQGRGYAAWLAKRMKAPDTKTFELEPVGAFVWSLCDGRHTFDAISRKLSAEYKMNRMEADAALGAFLQTLSQRGLITLAPKKT